MSTLRVSNIEAKADVSSPSVNEKVKITNSNGELLVHIDGATSGITTVGINTSGESVRFDSNQNVTFFGDITGTGLDINGNADISGNLNVGGVLTYEDVTNIDSVGIITAQSDISIADKIVHTGNTNTAIRFPAADTISFECAGEEILKIGKSSTELLRISGPVDGSTQQEFGIGIAVNDAHTHPAAKITLKEYDASDSRGDLLFYTRGTNNDVASTERLRITSGGDVVIGNSSAADGAHFQHYQSSARHQSFQSTNGDLAIVTDNNSNPVVYIKGTGTADLLNVFDNTTEVFTIKDGGNIGINKTNPTSYANSQATLVIEDDTNPAICISDTGQTKDWWLIGFGDGLGVRYADGGGSGSASNVTSAVFFKNNGNFGIGTNDPNRLLQVDGASGGNGQVLISTNGTFSGTDTADLSFRIYANPSNGNAHNPQAQIQAVGTGSYDAALVFKTAVGGSDNNAPVERLRINSVGDVGVGCDPQTDRRLHVKDTNAIIKIEGTSTYAQVEFATGSTAPAWIWRNPSSVTSYAGANSLNFYQTENAGYGFFTNAVNTPAMLVDGAGLVTKPKNPAFCVYRNQSTWALSAGDTFIFNAAEFNVGGHYNSANGRFTAPTTGTYIFHFYSIYLNSSSNDAIQMYKNNARMLVGDIHFSHPSLGALWDNITYTRIIQLNANDYVHMRTGAAQTYHGNHWGGWTGYMLG